MSGKTQPSRREDGFGSHGAGERGDGSLGETQSSRGGTGEVSGTHAPEGMVEGATNRDNAGAPGRRTPANKQGIPGQQD